MLYTRGQNSKQIVASNNLGEKGLLSGNDSVIYTAGAMTRKRVHMNYEILLLARLTSSLPRKSNARLAGLILGQPLCGAKLQSNPRGMPSPPGRELAVLELNGT